MGITFFKRGHATLATENADTLVAFARSQALIEFEPDGTIRSANENFLSLMGYDLTEVRGNHHSMFLDKSYASSKEYAEFWSKLVAGEFQRARFKRLGKNAKEVWIEASYNPLVGKDGKVYRIVKLASDVTARHHESADARGQLAAISRSQAVIEFSLDGTIVTANQNFCSALGYTLEEIRGRHHSIFVRPEEVADSAYREFWRRLSDGEYSSSEYLRIGKGGAEVWIQASYNPIFDVEGRPYKVVKYATDITARKVAVNRLSHALGLLAKGNLGHRIDGLFPAELEQVRLAFNDTVNQFNDIVVEMRQTSRALRSATGEILTGTNDLAERTTRQAAAIEETSAAVDQLAQAVSANAQRADAARLNARNVADEAQGAGVVMDQANLAMEEVTAQAGKISNIIGMIDDIAFQTNLLALNASVEAARAGDAGKGFAVVAVEVRRLAQSAASASSEVKGLIEQSNDAVSKGSKLVSTATERLGSMVGRVGENARLMDEIASANAEQSGAIAEVNTAIRQMDEMTQHNAALVEETNAAIEQTEEQAARVDSLMDRFEIRIERDVAVDAGMSRNRAVAKPRPGSRYRSSGSLAIAGDWNEF